MGPRARLARLGFWRPRPFRRTGRGVRCDLRESAVRGCRHQLLDARAGAPDRGRKGRAVGPQRVAELAAVFQRIWSIQLHQSRAASHRRRRGSGSDTDAARQRQPQPCRVRSHGILAGGARAGRDTTRHRLRRLGGGGVATARDTERGGAGIGLGAAAG